MVVARYWTHGSVDLGLYASRHLSSQQLPQQYARHVQHAGLRRGQSHQLYRQARQDGPGPHQRSVVGPAVGAQFSTRNSILYTQSYITKVTTAALMLI